MEPCPALSQSKYVVGAKMNSLSENLKMVTSRGLNILSFVFAEILSCWIISGIRMFQCNAESEIKICNLNWEQHDVNPGLIKGFILK